MRLWVSLGAFLGGLGVVLGAFGAHSLKDRLTEQKLTAFHTATEYLVIHSLALILVGILAAQKFFKLVPLDPRTYYVTEVPVYLNWDYNLDS